MRVEKFFSMHFFLYQILIADTFIHTSILRKYSNSISIWIFPTFVLAEATKKGGVKHVFGKRKNQEDFETTGLNYPIHSGASHIQ